MFSRSEYFGVGEGLSLSERMNVFKLKAPRGSFIHEIEENFRNAKRKKIHFLASFLASNCRAG